MKRVDKEKITRLSQEIQKEAELMDPTWGIANFIQGQINFWELMGTKKPVETIEELKKDLEWELKEVKEII